MSGLATGEEGAHRGGSHTCALQETHLGQHPDCSSYGSAAIPLSPLARQYLWQFSQRCTSFALVRGFTRIVHQYYVKESLGPPWLRYNRC